MCRLPAKKGDMPEHAINGQAIISLASMKAWRYLVLGEDEGRHESLPCEVKLHCRSLRLFTDLED